MFLSHDSGFIEDTSFLLLIHITRKKFADDSMILTFYRVLKVNVLPWQLSALGI